MLKAFALMLLSAALAFGADIAGTWKGTADSPNGQLTRTFTFKVDGSKLTGETESQFMGKSVIENGKVDGDNLSFTIQGEIQGEKVEVKYSGSVSGDTMKLKGEIASAGFTVEYVAKKQ